MKTVFACTHVTKDVTVDHYETGCETESTTIFAERINITAPTMAALIEKLNAAYGLTIDDIFIPEPNEPVPYFGYNRLEDEDGLEADALALDAWKRREQQMWLADYSFAIEKRLVSEVTVEDFQGIPGVN